MEQQQLQIARAALWHQTVAADPSAPLRTFDDAAQWLDQIGFCLFLPRHTQLLAPAPSFVEASLGEPSITPPPAAIAQAAELLARLVAERRIVPLNLLGAFSEQPDFLVTADVLPWVAAVRGDRQWKTAPGGRTSPIVLRTFEALDREGELTAIQLREIIGHEITESAALRALTELWTGLRAMPIAAPGEPTRWTLLKNRFTAQLATAANTAQTTALSALVSLYLQSAVAASAEEAEIFLSPLTARSRIREVLHGMMATRQLGTMSVASQTLLFVEGSLPEAAPAITPEAKPEPPKRISARPYPVASQKPPARKAPRPTRWELPPPDAPTQAEPNRPWQKKPAAALRPQIGSDRPRPGFDRPRTDSNRPRTGSGRPSDRPRASFSRPSGRPQQGPDRPRTDSNRPRQDDRRPPRGPRSAARPAFGRGFQQRSGAPGARPASGGDKPWQRRPTGDKPFRKFQQQNREGSPQSPPSESRPERKAPWRGNNTRPAPFGKNRKSQGDRPWGEQPRGPAQFRGPKPFRKDRGSEGRGSMGQTSERKGSEGQDKRPWRDRPRGPVPFQKKREGEAPARRPWRDRPASRGERSGASSPGGEQRPARPARPFRPGKSFAGKPGRPQARGSRPRPAGPPKNKFRKPFAGERKPRKNNQKETPE